MLRVELWTGKAQPLLGSGGAQVQVSPPAAFVEGKLEERAVGRWGWGGGGGLPGVQIRGKNVVKLILKNIAEAWDPVAHQKGCCWWNKLTAGTQMGAE